MGTFSKFVWYSDGNLNFILLNLLPPFLLFRVLLETFCHCKLCIHYILTELFHSPHKSKVSLLIPLRNWIWDRVSVQYSICCSDISKDFLKKKNEELSSSWTFIFVILCFHNLKIPSSRQLTSLYLRDTHFKNQIQSFNLVLFCNPKEKSHWVFLRKVCQ